MAFVTGTAIGNTLTLQAWSAKFHRETDDRNFWVQSGMRANDPGDEPTFERRPSAPVIVQEQLNAKRAQQVNVGLTMQLTTNHTAGLVRVDADGDVGIDDATYGTTTMIDQEEVMKLNSFITWVEQMKWATGFDTPDLQDLRTELKMTVQAADRLVDWFTEEREESINDAIYHQFSAHVIGGLSQTAADPLNNIYGGRVANAAALSSSERLTAAELRRLYTWAITENINPLRGVGNKMGGFCLLVHPFNYADLWADEEFRQYNAQGNVRGTGNPAMDMADFEFHGIYLYKYSRIRNPSSGANASNVRRCILLGADAVGEGVTMRPRLVRRKEDKYEDFFGLAVKGINGASRADWAPVTGTAFNQSSAVCSYYTNDSA